METKSSSTSTAAIIKQNLQDEETIIDNEEDEGGDGEEECCYIVDELAIATEHAPFRHKNIPLAGQAFLRWRWQILKNG